MEWEYGIGGGVVAIVLASYKVIGNLIAKRNGNNNKLKAHDDSSTAHKDIRADIEKIDGKLDKIKGTGDKILGRLDAMGSRPCQLDCEKDG